MAEAKEAEPNERAAPSPRRPRRNHVINLCCAQSVHKVVEEVARSLEHLGFSVTVVCGAEARAALLGSRTDSNQPTIHVVCVQGSMQERVLKPLRQALATHGGPNHHLFVAVLDLAVPLAMVGQIRRFAEALEGPAGDGQEREPTMRLELEQAPTRSYPTVAQVPERPGTKPPLSGDEPSRRTRPLTSRGRAAKVAPTAKYQAVTASHPVVPPGESAVRKRRRERSRLRPSAGRSAPARAERVLGLPEQDLTRDDSGPLPRREPPPPPPPPPTGETRRRSSAVAAAVVPPVSPSAPPPPPAPRRSSSSTTLRAQDSGKGGIEGATTAPHRPWPQGQAPPDANPPVPKPSVPTPQAPPSLEPDRLVPRSDSGFRFTPPGVKAAETRRTPSGPYTSVPLAEMLSDADRTMVQGRLEEVPRTASTLRLDEPPFKDGPAPRSPRPSPDDGDSIEPTMIIAAPTDPAADASDPPVERTRIEAPPTRPARASAPGASGPVTSAPGATASATPVSRTATPSNPAADASETEKTLLRSDGTFETAEAVLAKAAAARKARAPEPPREPVTEVRPIIALEPEDRGDSQADFKPKRTLLYADSVRAPLPTSEEGPAEAGGRTMVGPAPTAPSTAAPMARAPSPTPAPSATRSADAALESASPVEGKATLVPAARGSAPDEPAALRRRPPPSAIPTERHALPAITTDQRPSRRRPPAHATPSPAAATSSPTRAVPKPKPSSSSYGWLWILLVLLTGGGGWGAFQAGLFDGLLGREHARGTTVADASAPVPAGADPTDPARTSVGDPPSSSADAGGAGDAPDPATTSAADPSPEEPSADSSAAAGASTGEPEPADPGEPEPAAEPSNPPEEPEPEPSEPEPEPSDPPEPEPSDPAPTLTPEEQRLTPAVDDRRIFMLKTLFTTRRQGTATTFAGGWQRCANLEVDGVKGWRLPHRREMKLINVVLALPSGLYWTRTVPDDDKRAAYVLDTSTGALSLFLKQEPTGEVVCVRRREHPDR